MDGPPAERRGGRHEDRRQVPARPLRLVPCRRRGSGRALGRRAAGNVMTVVAAIDCGTNSTRLLVKRDGETVERLMRITRLGQDVDRTGRLDPDAIDRTIAVLREYREAMDRFNVERDSSHVRMTATSAARDAANRDDFFSAAESVIGVRPELLTGAE